ncbi:MAG: 30S ribosomal protein S12 methylthiotransferase RimO [Planctomycetota bacterium]
MRTEIMSEKAKGTYAFVSLGCPKNLVDSERMLGILASQGYVPVSDPRGADMVIVNTCGFIESARQESRAVIDEMVQLKQEGQTRGVIVTGCLAERLGDQLITEIPMIDHAVGVFGREDIASVADRFMNGAVEQRTVFRPAPVRALDDTARLRVTPRHYAYLKISEGCDRTCTFCAIPKMRGKHVTKPIEQILAEAEELVADGVRELLLVSQDTTYYGKDLYGEVRLADLLRQLDAVEGLEWIRVLYAYPEYIDDRLIETLASAQHIVPYLDMPLQHIADRVLKRMQRRHNRAQTESILGRLRAGWPGLSMRTTFIVGFPGETEQDFAELESFVREYRFERAGVFTYSYEEGTPAVKLDGHLPDEVKQERRERLMLAQQESAFASAQDQLGREIEVIVDAADPEFDGGWICRSTADAPEIDTLVFVAGEDLAPGLFTKANVVDVDEYDLIAEAVGKPW